VAFFTKQIETLNSEIQTARTARKADVTRLKGETAQILTDGRSLLKQISEQTHAMLAPRRKRLMSDRKALTKEVHSLREHNRRDMRRVGVEVRQMLSDNCTARQEQVREMLHGFARLQKDLAADFHGAARTWREGRHSPAAGTSAHSQHAGKDIHRETAPPNKEPPAAHKAPAEHKAAAHEKESAPAKESAHHKDAGHHKDHGHTKGHNN